MEKRVKILETNYDEDKHLVKWLVVDLDDEKQNEFTLAWIDDDLGPAVGINKKIPPYLIKKFCEDIKGKEINLVMEADKFNPDKDYFKNNGLEGAYKAHEHLDKYPFREVLEQETEKDE